MQLAPLFTSTGFALTTMTTRLPLVIRTVARTQADAYDGDVLADLERLAVEVETGCALRAPRRLAQRPSDELSEFDAEWVALHKRHAMSGWLRMPWFEAEAYLYRCLLECTRYFDAPVTGSGCRNDPFAPQKLDELHRSSTLDLLQLALAAATDDALPHSEKCSLLLHFCVLGNKADLCYSQVAASLQESSSLASGAAAGSSTPLLVDHSCAVAAHVARAPKYARFVFVCDNAGGELLCDLVLADWLLSADCECIVELFVKQHPTFVSDTCVSDVQDTLRFLLSDKFACTGPPMQACRALGARLEASLATRRLLVTPLEFFNSASFFDRLPESITVPPPHLVVIKGDANYRRVLGDCRWPVATTFEHVLRTHNPTLSAHSVLALRTCKSDPIVGIDESRASELDLTDPQWRVNGVRGIIQAQLV